MTDLEIKILAFENWDEPQTFFQSVSDQLSENDSILFREIWENANDKDIWQIHDLILACKITQTFVRESYGLDDNAIARIVRAITYNWR